MHLARTVTHSTVEECKSRMSLAEFRYWQALYRIEPWGDEWQQTRAVAVSNVAPWNKRAARVLHKFFPQAQQPTEADLEAKLEGFRRRHNAKVEREQKGGQQPSQSLGTLPWPSRRRRRG